MTGIRKIIPGDLILRASVQNRMMEDALTGSGYLADGSDFAGFSTVAALAAEATARTNADALLLGVYPVQSSETSVTSTQYPVGDVRRYGATANGIANDAAAVNNAILAAEAMGGGEVSIPKTRTVLVNSTVNLRPTVSLRVDGTLKAGASMTALVQSPLSTVVRYIAVTGTGTLDCNDLASVGLDLRYFGDVSVADIKVQNAISRYVRLGDPSAPSAAFGARVRNVACLRPSGSAAITAGSIGIYAENATDNMIAECLTVGAETGIRLDTSQNRVALCHAWAYSNTGWMVTAFDDNADGNEWTACYADTPQTYGFRLRKQYTRIVGGKVYNNNLYGADNVVVGVFFDTSAPLGVAILGLELKGQDSSHRLATDYTVSDDSNLIWQPSARLNVVTTHDTKYGAALQVPGSFTSSYFRLGSMTFWVESSGVTRCILGLPGSNTAGRLFAVGSADVQAKSANYSALSTDHASALRFTTAASALVLTVATTLPTGWRAMVSKVDSGAGTVTISGTSCTFNSVGATGAASLTISTQWKSWTIIHVGSGVFDVIAST